MGLPQLSRQLGVLAVTVLLTFCVFSVDFGSHEEKQISRDSSAFLKEESKFIKTQPHHEETHNTEENHDINEITKNINNPDTMAQSQGEEIEDNREQGVELKSSSVPDDMSDTKPTNVKDIEDKDAEMYVEEESCQERLVLRQKTLINTEELDGKGAAKYSERPEVRSDFFASPSVDKELDYLKLAPPSFLSNFKNPCWWEHFDEDSYQAVNERESFTKCHWYKKKAYNYTLALAANQTMRLRCLPYFYFIGVSKCGTTDMLYHINQHPMVEEPPVRNFIYWNVIRWKAVNESMGQRIFPLEKYSGALDQVAAQSLKWVEPHVTPLVNEGRPYHPLITGDASPTYAYFFENWKKIPENMYLKEPRVIIAHMIKRVVPQARIIINIRNPVDRLYSDYFFRRYQGSKSHTEFHDHVLTAIKMWTICLEHYSIRFCAYNGSFESYPVFLRSGMYYIYLSDWLTVFPRSQVHITRFEDYAEDRERVLNEVFNFLGLDPNYEVCSKEDIQNEGKKKEERAAMLPETRKILTEFYEPWNVKLAQLLQDDNYRWPEKNEL